MDVPVDSTTNLIVPARARLRQLGSRGLWAAQARPEGVRAAIATPRMILVTGASGYLGRALVARLLALGAPVRALCHRRPVAATETCIGSITDPAALERAMRGVQAVYHLAALVDHQATEAQLARVNVEGTRLVAEAARRHGVARLIHCSSVSAEPGGGSTAYGRSKIAAEACLAPYTSQLPIIVLRPGPVYDHERRNLQRLVRFARAARLAPMPVPDAVVHLASRRNVVDAFVRALAAGAAGRAYAICDAAPVPRSVLSTIVARETGARPLPVPMPLLRPLLSAAAVSLEALHALVRTPRPIDRHYVRVHARAPVRRRAGDRGSGLAAGADRGALRRRGARLSCQLAQVSAAASRPPAGVTRARRCRCSPPAARRWQPPAAQAQSPEPLAAPRAG